MTSKPPVDDSDLEDLLEKKAADGTTVPNTTGEKNKDGEEVSHTPLNLDHLTKGQLDVSPNRRSRGWAGSLPGGGGGICAYLSAWCSYMCYVHPRLCSCFAMGLIALGMFVLVEVVFNPTRTIGVISTDYSAVKSIYDLKMSKIDHWCLKGDDDSCRCDDPLEPTSRSEFKTWVNAHKENKALVKAYDESALLDVAFLGESLVEEMDGRWMGHTQGEELKKLGVIFRKHFKRSKTGMEGVALGIAGDTSPNVLWRLMHGEMPADFNPRVWWISLGMNDLGRMQCSEEVVVIGILRVVEQIRNEKPDAKIVINSMLPMADFRGGIYPQISDYRDAFRKYKGQPIINPQLRVAGNEVTKGIPESSKVKYQRPTTTTTALEQRLHERLNRMKLKQSQKRGESSNNSENDRRRRLPFGMMKKNRWRDNDEDGDGDAPVKTKQEARAERKYLNMIRRDPVNPKMDASKHNFRKHAAFQRNNARLPLWSSITAINRQLREFCEKNHPHVSFFDATDIFAEREEGTVYMLRSDRISVRGHPTVEGFAYWEEAVAAKLKHLLEKEDVELKQEAEAVQKKEKDTEAKSPEDDVKKEGDDSDSGQKDEHDEEEHKKPLGD